jgi:hypothetical protein
MKKKPQAMIFQFLNDICYDKKGDLINDSTKTQWSTFMVLRFLSMDKALAPIVNYLNKYQGILTKEEMYALLIEIVPKKKRFLKYVGAKNKSEKIDDSIKQHLSVAFHISKGKASEYVNFLSKKQHKEFVGMFGGKE